jgi:SAM-dependent methyltransferase
MADTFGMDPARIERLRSSERLVDFNPERFWEVLSPPSGPILDIGSGVGYLTLPFARRFPDQQVIGCDILDGMVSLLDEAAREEGLSNLQALAMKPGVVPVGDGSASLVCMAQVHHEIDDPQTLLNDCFRALAAQGVIAIVDWKDEDNGRSPPVGRRVPEADICSQLLLAGFDNIVAHEVFEFHGFVTATRPS